MHAIKGGWVGQTFALAKHNESEGRKSRIRHSKEERKAMVESFIQRYQKLNNGSFPSLNLTHKEVGGSFYTVREIVRDVIQENRVLGPAKFTAEEQTTDHFLEHNPLGSIAAEPQHALSVSSNESQFVTNQNQGSIGGLVFSSDGHLLTLEHQLFDNGRIINGTQVEVDNKEYDDVKSTELQVNGQVETEKNISEEFVVSNGHCSGPEYQTYDNFKYLEDKETEELKSTDQQTIEPSEAAKNVEEVLAASRSKMSHIAVDVLVETFPLKPVTGETQTLDGRLGEERDLTISTEDKGSGGMELAAGVDSLPTDRVNSMKSMLDDKVVVKLSSPLVENKPGSIEEEALGNARDPSLESSNCSTFNERVVHEKGSTEAADDDVPMSEIFDQSQLTAGAKAIKVPDSLHTKNINETSGSSELSNPKEVLLSEDEADAHSSGSLQKGSNPTLDRINLESWERRGSKKSAKPEGNPLWYVFKAFLDGFVKFWSE